MGNKVNWDEIIDLALERGEMEFIYINCTDDLEILARRVIGIIYKTDSQTDTTDIFQQQFLRLTSVDDKASIERYYVLALEWWTKAYAGD